MKIILTSIALAMATTSAYAADAIIEEPVAVVVPDTFSWTGGYIGINAGYAGGKFKHPFEFGFDEEFAANGSLDVTSSGFVGGVQAGYNYQFDNGFVLGAEADFQGSNIKGEVKFNANDGFEGISGKAGTKVEWFGTVRARLGYTATERLLVYGTGGLAYGKVKSYADYDFDGEGGGISSSKTKAGWTVGAGAEYAFTDNWTIKSEYLYTDLGKRNLISYNDGEGSSFSLDNKVKFHTVRVGLNYKF